MKQDDFTFHAVKSINAVVDIMIDIGFIKSKREFYRMVWPQNSHFKGEQKLGTLRAEFKDKDFKLCCKAIHDISPAHYDLLVSIHTGVRFRSAPSMSEFPVADEIDHQETQS